MEVLLLGVLLGVQAESIGEHRHAVGRDDETESLETRHDLVRLIVVDIEAEVVDAGVLCDMVGSSR